MINDKEKELEGIKMDSVLRGIGVVVGATVLLGNVYPARGGDIEEVTDAVCKIVTTVTDCTQETSLGSEARANSWAAAGGTGYTLAAAEMKKRQPLGRSLTSDQKKYLRPYFGDLVDKVTVHYNASLMSDIGVYPFIFRFGDSEAQAFGYNIYLKYEYRTTFQQVALIAHELVHSAQYERLGTSLVRFGEEYFEAYSRAGRVYENNAMEVEAYDIQNRFITNDCAGRQFSGECPVGTKLDEYNYDYGEYEVVLYLDGTSGTVSTEIPPETKETVALTLSEADKQRLAVLAMPGCASTYDPTNFRPGTAAWDGKVGKIAFYNGTTQNTIVSLYHPDAPTTAFGTWNIAPGVNTYLGEGPYGMDWGIKVDNSNPCIIGKVSNWDNNVKHFQTWPEKVQEQQTASPVLAACSATYDPTPYKPGSSGWNGRVGKIAFYNGKENLVKVTLYHPDAPSIPFGVWEIPSKVNLFLGEGPYGMDWGVQVDDGNICIIDTASNWDDTAKHFQTWPEKLL